MQNSLLLATTTIAEMEQRQENKGSSRKKQQEDAQKNVEYGLASIQLGISNTLVARGNLIVQATVGHPLPESSDTDMLVKWLSELSPFNFHAIHKDIHEKVTPCTGNWVFELAEYKKWEVGWSKILWGTGMPGAGKTCLISVVIDHLMKTLTSNNSPATIIFVYCQYQDQLTTTQILATLLKQLVENSESAAKYVASTLYKSCMKTQTKPIRSELVRTLQATAKLFSRIFIAIDALDELDRQVSHDVVNDLITVDQSLFMTSRPLILSKLSNPDFVIRAPSQDFQVFIRSQIMDIPGLEKLVDDEKIDDAVDKIKTKADGMFLLAALQLSTLSAKEVTSVESLEKSIAMLPSSLNATYDSTMHRILQKSSEVQSLVYHALLHVVHAKRALRIDELLEALAVDLETVTLDCRRCTTREVLLTSCLGLLVLQEESQVVQLTHYTVKEWLETQTILSFITPHAFMANVCAAYLSLTVSDFTLIQSSDDLKKVEEKHRFFAYAIRNLGYHTSLGSPHRLPAQVQNLFNNHPLILLVPSVDGVEFIDHGGILHFAAWYGLETVVKKNYKQIKKQGMRSSPTFYACLGGHLSIVQKFLNHNDFNCGWVTRFGGTCMHAVVENGSVHVLQLLLHKRESSTLERLKQWLRKSKTLGMPINAKLPSQGQTALFLACKNGHAPIVEELLKIKSETSENSAGKWTALHIAAQNGHANVVQLLVSTPEVNVNAREKDNWTPLHLAADNDHVDVAQLLVATPGVDVNAREDNNWTPLHLAAKNSHLNVAQLLIATPGVDVNVRDKNNWTPLHFAAKSGHVNVAQLLTATPGVDVNAREKHNWTALHLAAKIGYVNVTQLLIATPGVNVNAREKKNWTPLHLAAENGHMGVAQLLVAAPGVDVNARDKKNWTPLHFAAKSGHVNVAQLLIATPGVDFEATTENRNTPLHLAAQNGHVDVVQIFVATPGVDFKAKSKTGRTALHLAAQNGHVNVTQLLVATPGVDSQATTETGNTPLHLAAQNGHVNVVQLLVATSGVDVNARDKNKWTPLHLAAQNGHLNVAQLLVTTPGVDINAREDNNWTPHYIAAKNSHFEVAEILVAT